MFCQLCGAVPSEEGICGRCTKIWELGNGSVKAIVSYVGVWLDNPKVKKEIGLNATTLVSSEKLGPGIPEHALQQRYVRIGHYVVQNILVQLEEAVRTTILKNLEDN